MNPTSRAILQTVMATDVALTPGERDFVQRLISGEIAPQGPSGPGADERLLVTQKRAAELLSVSRITIWRMTKELVLHPIEILPGTWRYPFGEIMALARTGIDAGGGRAKSAA